MGVHNLVDALVLNTRHPQVASSLTKVAPTLPGPAVPGPRHTPPRLLAAELFPKRGKLAKVVARCRKCLRQRGIRAASLLGLVAALLSPVPFLRPTLGRPPRLPRKNRQTGHGQIELRRGHGFPRDWRSRSIHQEFPVT
jgi:hypothetical protein